MKRPLPSRSFLTKLVAAMALLQREGYGLCRRFSLAFDSFKFNWLLRLPFSKHDPTSSVPTNAECKGAAQDDDAGGNCCDHSNSIPR